MPTPENVCAICHGTGFFLKEETQKECICTLIKVIALKLGPEIGMAPNIKSPLFLPGEPGEEPVVDRTKTNLFLKGWWSDLLPHFKWALVCKLGTVGPRSYFFHIVTDERLKSVWLDKEAYSSRAKKKREEVPTYNSLSDLIGNSYNLVIIRLGFLGYKNIAMAGILKEALMIRQALMLPTWIVEEPDSIFGPGHFSFNEEVGDYILQRFEILNFTKDREVEVTPRGVEGSTPVDEGMAVDEELERRPMRPVGARSRPQMPEERLKAKTYAVEDDPLISGGGRYKRNDFRKKPSGGGPV